MLQLSNHIAPIEKFDSVKMTIVVDVYDEATFIVKRNGLSNRSSQLGEVCARSGPNEINVTGVDWLFIRATVNLGRVNL